MNGQELKAKIAYKVYEIFRDAEMDNTSEGNWNIACRIYRHFFTEPDYHDIWWFIDEEDYKAFREIL